MVGDRAIHLAPTHGVQPPTLRRRTLNKTGQNRTSRALKIIPPRPYPASRIRHKSSHSVTLFTVSPRARTAECFPIAPVRFPGRNPPPPLPTSPEIVQNR